MSDESDTLAALYAGIPTFRCRAGCHDCCGPVPVTPLEAKRLGIPGEPMTRTKPGTMTCEFVGPLGECTVYEKRPYICRMFGATVDMRLHCHHGCRPVGQLSMPETDRRSHAYMALMSDDNFDAIQGVVGPRPLWKKLRLEE